MFDTQERWKERGPSPGARSPGNAQQIHLRGSPVPCWFPPWTHASSKGLSKLSHTPGHIAQLEALSHPLTLSAAPGSGAHLAMRRSNLRKGPPTPSFHLEPPEAWASLPVPTGQQAASSDARGLTARGQPLHPGAVSLFGALQPGCTPASVCCWETAFPNSPLGSSCGAHTRPGRAPRCCLALALGDGASNIC